MLGARTRPIVGEHRCGPYAGNCERKWHTFPHRIQADNGPAFISLALGKWPYENAATLDFSRPGKPTGNAFIESFDGRLRDEGLNVNWFMSLDDTRRKHESRGQSYNCFRSHSALADPRQPCSLTKLPKAKKGQLLQLGLSTSWRDISTITIIRLGQTS